MMGIAFVMLGLFAGTVVNIVTQKALQSGEFRTYLKGLFKKTSDFMGRLKLFLEQFSSIENRLKSLENTDHAKKFEEFENKMRLLEEKLQKALSASDQEKTIGQLELILKALQKQKEKILAHFPPEPPL